VDKTGAGYYYIMCQGGGNGGGGGKKTPDTKSELRWVSCGGLSPPKAGLLCAPHIATTRRVLLGVRVARAVKCRHVVRVVGSQQTWGDETRKFSWSNGQTTSSNAAVVLPHKLNQPLASSQHLAKCDLIGSQPKQGKNWLIDSLPLKALVPRLPSGKQGGGGILYSKVR